MKTPILFLLLLINSLVSSAQKLDIFWSDNQKLKRSTVHMEILFADNDGVYAKDSRNGGYFGVYSNYTENDFTFRKFDNSYEQIFERTYKKELKGKHFNRFVNSNDRIFMFADDYEHSGKEIATFAMEIDKTDGEPKTDWKLISSIAKSRSDEFYYYNIEPNADSTLMVFSSRLTDKTEECIKVTLINEKLDEIATTEINLTYPKKAYRNQSIFVDTDNGIFITGQVFEEVPYKKNRTKFVFKKMIIEKYDFTGKKIYETPTTVSGKTFVNAGLRYDNKNDLIVAGFYTDDLATKEINGIFVTRLNASTGTIIMQTAQKIDNVLIGKFSEDDDTEELNEKKKAIAKEEDDEEGISPSYILKEIGIGYDNSILLVAEKYFLQEFTLAGNSGTAGGLSSSGGKYTRFYSRDILTVKLSQDGDIKFIHVLPKNQTEAEPGSSLGLSPAPFPLIQVSGYLPFSSFTSFLTKNKLIYIFNDHEDNVGIVSNNSTAKTISNFKKSTCFTVTIDIETGKATRKILFSSEDDPIPMIRHAVIYKNNLFILALEGQILGKTNMHLGRITVK